MKRTDIFELPGHIALAMLGHPAMNDAHRADLLVACQLGIDLGDERIRELASSGLAMLQQGSSDYDQMRHAIGTVLQWIGTQPNRTVHDAVMRRLKRLDSSEPEPYFELATS